VIHSTSLGLAAGAAPVAFFALATDDVTLAAGSAAATWALAIVALATLPGRTRSRPRVTSAPLVAPSRPAPAAGAGRSQRSAGR